MNYKEFIRRVSEKAGLDREHAEVTTQVVLTALGESLSDREIKHLSSQLARELEPMLQNVLGHGRPYAAGSRHFARRFRRRRCATCSASCRTTSSSCSRSEPAAGPPESVRKED